MFKIISMVPVGARGDFLITYDAPTFLFWRVRRFSARGSGTVWHFTDNGAPVPDEWLFDICHEWRKKKWELDP